MWCHAYLMINCSHITAVSASSTLSIEGNSGPCSSILWGQDGYSTISWFWQTLQSYYWRSEEIWVSADNIRLFLYSFLYLYSFMYLFLYPFLTCNCIFTFMLFFLLFFRCIYFILYFILWRWAETNGDCGSRTLSLQTTRTSLTTGTALSTTTVSNPTPRTPWGYWRRWHGKPVTDRTELWHRKYWRTSHGAYGMLWGDRSAGPWIGNWPKRSWDWLRTLFATCKASWPVCGWKLCEIARRGNQGRGCWWGSGSRRTLVDGSRVKQDEWMESGTLTPLSSSPPNAPITTKKSETY